MGLFKRAPKTPLATEAELIELRQQVTDLKTQLQEAISLGTETKHKSQELTSKVNSLDARVTQVGSEVTHQLSELSGDIDSLEKRTKQLTEDTATLPGEIEHVRHDQEELAREQARYQIAFRQDLAEAIEMLQKKR